MIIMEVEEKLDKLKDYIQDKKVIVAFSGGADSTLLALIAQKEAKLIRKGNKLYKDGEFKEAEINYRKSLQINDKSVKSNFNLGDALYEQKDYEGSQQLFDALSKKIEDPMQRAEAFHNLGNSLLAADKYQESIEKRH